MDDTSASLIVTVTYHPGQPPAWHIELDRKGDWSAVPDSLCEQVKQLVEDVLESSRTDSRAAAIDTAYAALRRGDIVKPAK